MTTTILGIISLAVVFWAVWAKKFPRANVVLALIAGFTLAGGMLYDIAQRGANVLQSAVTAISNALVGASVSLVIGVLLVLELWRVLTRRGGGQPHRVIHPILAFLAPVLLMAAGGIFAELAGLLDRGVDSVNEVTRTVIGMRGR
ncbi:MAG: hypothetical protein GEV04_21055 [Actinophytocola sp.]|nr:hypothetical protein [Actinophytocola sp.]